MEELTNPGRKRRLSNIFANFSSFQTSSFPTKQLPLWLMKLSRLPNFPTVIPRVSIKSIDSAAKFAISRKGASRGLVLLNFGGVKSQIPEIPKTSELLLISILI